MLHACCLRHLPLTLTLSLKGEGTVLRARRLPGLPERSPDQAFTPPSGTLPAGAALAGATRP